MHILSIKPYNSFFPKTLGHDQKEKKKNVLNDICLERVAKAFRRLWDFIESQ